MTTSTNAKRVLVIGVGKICANIVESINRHKPSVIFFFCSGGKEGTRDLIDGKGKVCAETYNGQPNLPNILIQAGIQNKENAYPVITEGIDVDNLNQKEIKDKSHVYIITTDDVDSLEGCYKKACKIFERIRQVYSNHEIIVDVTPGTKSMTIGLFAASSMIPAAVVTVTKAERVSAYQMLIGSESLRRLSRDAVYTAGHFQLLDAYINKFDYDSAVASTEHLLANYNLDPELVNRLEIHALRCKVFAAWHKFDHSQAWKLMERTGKFDQKNKYCQYLTAVLASRNILDSSEENVKPPSNASGYEAVEDLLHNAERQAINGRYDDAVARIYRALEMLMQLRLKRKFGISTANVPLDKLPEKMRQQVSESSSKDPQPKNAKPPTVKLSLVQGYQFLESLGDSLGQEYATNKSSILDALEIRNHSILAHGTKPVGEQEYKKVDQQLGKFIKKRATAYRNGKQTAYQLPRTIEH